MNVTHNLSTCKSESIKIIRFLDIFNIKIIPSSLWYDHLLTARSRGDILFYTSPSSSLWFLSYFAKSRNFQKANYKGNAINFSQFQARGVFVHLRSPYLTQESINSLITFYTRALLELLSSNSPLCLGLLRTNKTIKFNFNKE